MIEQTFTLIPFPALDLPEISLTGTVLLDNHVLTLHYSLSGNTEDLLLPVASFIPGRKEQLWKSTCFEFFLATNDQPGYWEFNMSPSGDWNVYRMEAYRRIGFREEIAISQLPFETKKEVDRYSLDVSANLAPLIEPGQEIQMAVTAIIQTKDGKETYWALTHPGPYPDFHLRESFILPLATQTHPSAGAALDG